MGSPEFPQRFGPFVLLRELGAGGMGSAYLGLHPDTDTLVVVKRMHPEYLKDAGIFKRFVHEAEVAAHVRHPNVAALVAMGTVDREPFLATEYVFGIQVSHIVERVESSQIEPVPLAVALRLALDLAQGIEAIHEARHMQTGEPLGLIHRDIGSRNALIGFDGALRIIDLGLGKSVLADWQTASQVLAGSPDYMPPEQAMGARVDGRADVYSAAVTIWELIAGRKRIREEGVAARLTRAISAQPEVLLDRRPDAPRRLEAVLKQGMHPDPEQRTPTARVLVRALAEEAEHHARGTGAAEVAAWLDLACATIIARERRILAEVRALAGHRLEPTSARTEMFVGKAGDYRSVLRPYDFYFASNPPRPAKLEAEDPTFDEPRGAGLKRLATSPSAAALAALVDPEQYKSQPRAVRWALGAAAGIFLLGVAVAAGILFAPEVGVQVLPGPEISGAPPAPRPPTLPPPDPAPITEPPDPPPGPTVEQAQGGESEGPRPVPAEVAARKSELLRRLRQLRRLSFDVQFQRKLTQLSTRLSQARSMKTLDEIEAALVRLERRS